IATQRGAEPGARRERCERESAAVRVDGMVVADELECDSRRWMAAFAADHPDWVPDASEIRSDFPGVPLDAAIPTETKHRDRDIRRLAVRFDPHGSAMGGIRDARNRAPMQPATRQPTIRACAAPRIPDVDVQKAAGTSTVTAKTLVRTRALRVACSMRARVIAIDMIDQEIPAATSSGKI